MVNIALNLHTTYLNEVFSLVGWSVDEIIAWEWTQHFVCVFSKRKQFKRMQMNRVAVWFQLDRIVAVAVSHFNIFAALFTFDLVENFTAIDSATTAKIKYERMIWNCRKRAFKFNKTQLKLGERRKKGIETDETILEDNVDNLNKTNSHL